MEESEQGFLQHAGARSPPRTTEGEKRTPYRRLVVLTMTCFVGFIAHGLSSALPGATLLDLARQTGSSVAEVSWILTGRSLGGIVGALAVLVVGRKCSLWFPLAVSQVLQGVLMCLVPLCTDNSQMIALLVGVGVGRSFLDAGSFSVLLDIWGPANGPWLPGMAAMYGIGAFIAPLIAEPYINGRNTSHSVLPDANATAAAGHLQPQLVTTNDSPVVNLSTNTGFINIAGVTNQLLVPYAIVGAFVILSGVAFLVDACMTYSYWHIYSYHRNYYNKSANKSGDKRVSANHSVDNARRLALPPGGEKTLDTSDRAPRSGGGVGSGGRTVAEARRKRKSSSRRKKRGVRCDLTFEHVMLGMLTIFTTAGCIVTHTCGMFIVTFAVEYVNMQTSAAVVLLSVFYAVSTGSQVIAALLAKCLQPKFMLIAFISVSVASAVTLALGSRVHPMVFWGAICGFAVGNSPLFPLGVTYADRYVAVTPGVSGLLQLACTLAAVVAPFIVTLVYETIGPICLVYILLFGSCMHLGIFACMRVLSRQHGKRDEYCQCHPKDNTHKSVTRTAHVQCDGTNGLVDQTLEPS